MTTIQGIDYSFLQFIHSYLNAPIIDRIMIFVTRIGDNGAIWVGIALLLLITKKYRSVGITIIIALVLCLFIGNLTLKPYFARIRPFNAYTNIVLLINGPKDFSFPSGHAMTSFACATVLYLKRRSWGLYAIGLAALIAFSRMYLFVHYPSDIIVGILIGILIGLFSVKVTTLVDQYYKSK